MSAYTESWEQRCEQSLTRSRERRSAPPRHILTRQNAAAAILSAIAIAVLAFGLLLAAALAVQP